MSDQNDRSEHPTDPVSKPPPSQPGHALVLPPQAAVPEPQPDPNNYSHFALGQLLARVRGLEADKGAVDFKSLAADVGIIRSSVGALQQSMDAIVTRVGNTERAVTANEDANRERFERIELDMAATRAQLDRLDRELAILRGLANATGSATPKAE